jgi:26S proteasome regulatory subunit N7
MSLSCPLPSHQATELFPYSQFVLYTIVASMVAESRTVIGAKIVKSPEVFGSIDEVPHLSALLHSLHACRYADFFSSLTAVFAAARTDRFLAPHARHLQRELRLVAYSQFLVSYKSVTLASMAAAFAISVPLLDSDLAQFIYAGRLSCKIDKVSISVGGGSLARRARWVSSSFISPRQNSLVEYSACFSMFSTTMFQTSFLVLD